MRITNSIILRGYNRDLNRLMTEKTACERRITSTRKFSRASENPLSAAKALNVRRSMYNLTQYQENLKTANKFYTEAETSLLQVSDKMASIREELVAACNTTKDSQEYAIYGEYLETIAKELVSIFNTDSAGRAIFGGESDDPTPFTLLEDSTGHLSTVCYHGIPVSALDDYMSFPYSTPVTVDVGLGMAMDQNTQEVNPQSVLDISFNGAKITGCGADSGTADIDLSSIKNGRRYSLDVFVGGIKKTIEFTGKATQEDNVKNIQAALSEAFKKERAYNKVGDVNIDDRGVIYCEGEVVSAVNNPNNPNAEQLKLDNDSGYTNKFKLNFAALKDGQEHSIDVTVDGVTQTIKFIASDKADIAERRKETVENIQAALDEAFGVDAEGKSLVSISDNPVTQGVFSAEGKTVKVSDSMKLAGSEDAPKVTIDSVRYSQIRLNGLSNGSKYSITVNGKEVVFEAGADTTATRANLQKALGDAGVVGTVSALQGDDNMVYIKDGDNFLSISETPADKKPADAAALKPTTGAEYTVDLNTITSGEEYSLKVVYDGRVKLVTFTGGATAEENQRNIQNALREAFGQDGVNDRISIDEKGKISTYDGNSVEVTSTIQGSAEDPSVVERHRIYSNNYIQLTLDAARALREGDIEYANGCIDRIVSANEHLLVQIADLGCNEDFIDFNIEKLTTRELNLSERQNDLEVTDAEKEITLWKTYEALYNACLQMSASVVPQSIFNYMS